MTPLPPEKKHDGASLPACAEQCPLSSRRTFLRESLVGLAVALAAAGLDVASAAALSVENVDSIRARGGVLTYPVPAADGAQIDRKNEVILVRWNQLVYAFNLSCPHQNTALRWDDRDRDFICPKHHSRFQPDGGYIQGSGRATRNMDRFAITLSSDTLQVDVDKLYQEDTDGPQWNAAFIKLA